MFGSVSTEPVEDTVYMYIFNDTYHSYQAALYGLYLFAPFKTARPALAVVRPNH